MTLQAIIKTIIHPAEEGGFWAEVPALPGCVTQGETESEIQANLLEVIGCRLEAGEVTARQDKDSRILELAI